MDGRIDENRRVGKGAFFTRRAHADWSTAWARREERLCPPYDSPSLLGAARAEISRRDDTEYPIMVRAVAAAAFDKWSAPNAVRHVPRDPSPSCRPWPRRSRLVRPRPERSGGGAGGSTEPPAGRTAPPPRAQ